MPRTSEALLVRDAMDGIPADVKEALNNLMLETITTSQKGGNNRVPAAWESIVLRTVQMVVKSRDFIVRFSDRVIDNLECVTAVAAFIKFEQRELVT